MEAVWPGINRPSDRVRGCGTAQFGKTRTITHNSEKFAKYCTIRSYLVLKILIKTRFSIECQEIEGIFYLGYYLSDYFLENTLVFPRFQRTTRRLVYTNNKASLL